MSANPRLMRTELLLGEDGIRRLQQAMHWKPLPVPVSAG